MTTMAVATVIVPDMSDGISQMEEDHALVAESRSYMRIVCTVMIVTDMVDICLQQLECLYSQNKLCAENMQP